MSSSDHEELSQLMTEDARSCLELVEEQMGSLGTRCPDELLYIYEDIVPHLRARDDVTGHS